MQERTGAMAQFENDADAKAAGYTPIRELLAITDKYGKTQVSPEEMKEYWKQKTDELYGMNRKRRRAWASRQRRSK